MKKFLIAFMLFVLIISVASCGGDKDTAETNGTSDDRDATTEQVADETLPPLLDADEAIPYADAKLVRADKSEQWETDAAVEVRKAILAKGEKVELITDWTKPTGGIEIIIGKTSRAEAPDFKLDEYEIKRDGNNIFILAGGPDSMTKAVAYFEENLMGDTGILIPDKYDYINRSTATVEAFSISGKKVTDVTILAGKYGKTFAAKLADLITEKVGVTSAVVEVEKDANILFKTEDGDIGNDEWGLVCRDGKLYIVGADDLKTKAAYNYFVNELQNKTALEYDGVVHKETFDPAANLDKELVIYPEFPEQVRRIYDYDVTVTMDGRTEKLPVYNHTDAYNISRRPGVDMYRRFSCFAFNGGQVRVDVKVKKDFTSYTVFPSAKNFKHDFKDGVISVYLDKPDYFGIQLDDDQNTIISIIADYPENPADIPSKDDKNVIYIDSWYETKNGVLTVDKDDTTVYIAPGAVLNTRVEVTASNCRIIGRGAIVDPFENIYEYDVRDGGTEWLGYHPVNFQKGTANNTIDGIFILDSRTHTVRTVGDNHTIRNLKEFSSLLTTDGIQMQSENSLAEHCYVYVGDNALVVGSHYGNTFRDITIGTSCAALFPEAKADKITFEDIYVFRADDGIFNHFNIAKGQEAPISGITVKNLSAMELPEGLTHFFMGRSAGSFDKYFTFENVSIPDLAQTIVYENSANYTYTDNYNIKLTNFAVGGSVLKSASELNIKNVQKAKNTETVTTSGSFTPIKRNMKVVNYKATDKVYAGMRQLFLSEIKKDGGKLSFKTDEICEMLRVPTIAGKEYVTADDLKAAKAVSDVKESGGVLYLTPVYNGENILLPDEGEISHYTEATCYQLDFVAAKSKDGYIYSICDYNGTSGTAGVSRPVLEDLQMYGPGTYCVKFSVRAADIGTMASSLAEYEEKIPVNTEWKEISYNVNISENDLKKPSCVFKITEYGKILPEYSFRDVSITKIK